MRKILLLTIIWMALPNFNLNAKDSGLIRVLLLSGRNNHDWRNTTPVLYDILTKSGKFAVFITERPDTLSGSDFSKSDVVISNWNSWPENNLRWPEQTENALLEFIQNGGGFVTFHSASSVFYNWPGFRKISTAAWILDSTYHGEVSEIQVSINQPNHPVTKGCEDFKIIDELWFNASGNPDFEILGVASDKNMVIKNNHPQPAIMVAGYGKGRIFHTVLGHDVTALKNTGFQCLLLRAAEWSATGFVKSD